LYVDNIGRPNCTEKWFRDLNERIGISVVRPDGYVGNFKVRLSRLRDHRKSKCIGESSVALNLNKAIRGLPEILHASRWTLYVDNIGRPNCTEKWFRDLNERIVPILSFKSLNHFSVQFGRPILSTYKVHRLACSISR
jgi:hypothetical protein